uniref:UDP-glucose 4-epimerase GalE n=1 Tax=Orrella sp. TaxID=1921583 RepID=UPI004055428E
MATILVTGGAGYIGSHTLVQLLEAGHEAVVVDNFCNSHAVSLSRVQEIAGRPLSLVRGDIRDKDLLREVFASHAIDAVIHFAGLKAVGESQENPALYYDNNVVGSLSLVQVMAEAGVKSMVFSSSATVYGDQEGQGQYSEEALLAPTNVYGRTKRMVEDLLRDVAASDPAWRVVLLRYFNPVGAHPSGSIGEDPNGIPNNLMPFVAQVAVGKRDRLRVFGDDYPTPDGTGLRDYIHVEDLARGHLAALNAFSAGVMAVNLGTGRPYSVLEMVSAFERASGQPVPYEVVQRRSGDAAVCFADAQKARRILGWQADLGIDRMCEDAWRWQQKNPDGYGV